MCQVYYYLKKAPVNLIIFAFVFYLSLIVVSNVLLDTFDNAKWAVITVRGLFTLQSIPAALIVAVRTQHRDLIANIEKERANKANQSRTVRQNDELETNGSRTFASLNQSEKYSLSEMDTAEAATFWNVTPRAIQKWKIRVNEEISQGKL